MQKKGKESPRFIDRTGETYITTEGYKITIIEYFGWDNCTIQFEDGFIIRNSQYTPIKLGNIKNPFHKVVANTGFFGTGVYDSKHKSYKVWQDMILRCYSERVKRRQPTYENCRVLDTWHNFQNFAEWFEENYKDYMKNWYLDKDILKKGNKVYSPETCCFVPRIVNNAFTKNDILRGEYPIGVVFVESEGKYMARMSVRGKPKTLGRYDTSKEAFEMYKYSKEQYIKELAEEYKNQISEPCYIAMYNYKVEIND